MEGENEKDFFSARNWPLALLVIVGLGVAIGACSAGLTYLLDFVQKVCLGWAESLDDPTPFITPWWRRLVSIALASFIASLIWYLIRKREKPIPSVSGAVAGKPMPVLRSLTHIILQIVIVGAGLPVGRETAPRELGALFGQKLSSALRLSKKDIPVVIAVAAGAGFAGVYNAPLAGTFFALEILLSRIELPVVGLALGTSLVSTFTAGFLKGIKVFYQLPVLKVTIHLMVFSCLIGPLCGLAAFFFRMFTQWANRRQETSRKTLWMLPLMGLMTGLVAIVFPQVMGNGRSQAQMAYGLSLLVQASGGRQVAGFTGLDALKGLGDLSLGSLRLGKAVGIVLLVLMVLIVAKTLLAGFTIRAGAAGGVLTPAVAVGACLGAMLALLISLAFPSLGLSVGICAYVASAAFLATSQKAPLMATAFMLELTHASISFVLPLGLAAGLSVLTSFWLEQSPWGKVTSKAASLPAGIKS